MGNIVTKEEKGKDILLVNYKKTKIWFFIFLIIIWLVIMFIFFNSLDLPDFYLVLLIVSILFFGYYFLMLLPLKIKIIKNNKTIVIEKTEYFYIKRKATLQVNKDSYLFAKRSIWAGTTTYFMGGTLYKPTIKNKNDDEYSGVDLFLYSFYLSKIPREFFYKDEIEEIASWLGIKVKYEE
jgi:hypothetical protein